MTTTTAPPPALADRDARSRPRQRSHAAAASAKQPAWLLPSLLALLAATAALYLVDLSASGTANSFYAAAVQAASKSWKAWFFGSLDSSNFITVDKPPASLWIMGLSARIFGFSSWSLLVPQALEGVGTVLLVVLTVRRALDALGTRVAAAGGLLGGAIVAATPAAALMFRFDNPDALLTLLMAGAGYAVVRAVPRASWRWLAFAGALLGFAFLTKMLQGLLVLPAFALVYLIAADTTVVRRIVHLLVAGAALVVAAGWWVLAVALWPADARPYIGGSTNNTVLDLVFGYNGLGRIFGGSGNGGGGGSGTSGSSFGGATGLQRLFSSEMGLEISWLLPAALIALVLGLVAVGRAPRRDLARAGLIASGGWLVVTGLVFSFMSGTIHPYYTVALAPAIAGTVAIGGALLWARRSTWLGTAGLAALAASGGTWAFVLLGEDATWLPWLRWTLLVVALLSTAGILAAKALHGAAGRGLLAVAVIGAILSGLGGGAAYSIATASVPHSGSIPSVGSTSISGGMGGGMGGGTGGPGGSGSSSHSGPPSGTSGTRPTGAAPSGSSSSSSSSSSSTSTGSSSMSTSTGSSATGGAMQGGGATSSAALTALLKKAGTTWSAAVDGSQSAATLELSSGTAVMAIGGWSSDPTPTLAQFESAVAAGEVHYYIASGSGSGGGMGGGTSTASAILTWVKAHYTATTVGGSTVYDLTKAKA